MMPDPKANSPKEELSRFAIETSQYPRCDSKRFVRHPCGPTEPAASRAKDLRRTDTQRQIDNHELRNGRALSLVTSVLNTAPVSKTSIALAAPELSHIDLLKNIRAYTNPPPSTKRLWPHAPPVPASLPARSA